MSKSIKVVKGKLPILFSAPHVYQHKRPHLEGKYKQREEFTDQIGIQIANEIDAFSISTTQTLEYDPNYHKLQDNEYKTELKKIVKENKIKYVIDLHGLSDMHPYDVGVFFKREYKKSREFGYYLAQGLAKGKLNDAMIYVFNFLDNEQETISEFACDKLRVPAVQLEIAWYIREDDVLRAQFTSNLSELIRKLPIV